MKKSTEDPVIAQMRANLNATTELNNRRQNRDVIIGGIKAEKEAIAYYEYLISKETNGNDRRSWIHARNEERDHLKLLENKLKRLPI